MKRHYYISLFITILTIILFPLTASADCEIACIYIPEYHGNKNPAVSWQYVTAPIYEIQEGWGVSWYKMVDGQPVDYNTVTDHDDKYTSHFAINCSYSGVYNVTVVLYLQSDDPIVKHDTIEINEIVPDTRLGMDNHWGYEELGFGSGGEGYVNVSTGNLTIKKVDYVIPNEKLPFELIRYYNSECLNEPFYDINFGLGFGWRLNFDMVLDTSPGNQSLIMGDGSVYRFLWDSDYGWYRDKNGRMYLAPAIIDKDGTRYEFGCQVPGETHRYFLTKIEDRWGNSIVINRHGEQPYPWYEGMIDTIVDAVGNVINFHYNGEGIDYIELPGNRFIDYELDGDHLIEVWNPNSFTGSTRNPNYGCTQYDYNSNNKIVSITDLEDNLTQIQYVEYSGQVEEITQGQHTTSFEYLSHSNDEEYSFGPYRDTEVTYPNGHVKIYTYNGSDYSQLVKARETFTVDPDNNETEVERSLVFEYNSDYKFTERRLTYKEVGGSEETEYIERYYYDDRQNLIKTERWDPADDQGPYSSILYTYAFKGNENLRVLTSKTNEMGRVMTYYYDDNDVGEEEQQIDLGNLALVTISEADEIKLYAYEYDEPDNPVLSGLLTKESVYYDDSNTFDTTYEYDNSGFLSKVERQIDRDGLDFSVTEYSYSSATGLLFSQWNSGNDLSIMPDESPNEKKRWYMYDKTGRLLKVTDTFDFSDPNWLENMTLHIFEYDKNGNRTYEKLRANRSDTEYQITEYVYDEISRVTDIIDPLGHTIEYEYDEVGNITKITDKDDYITEYTYDELGNKTSEIRLDGSNVIYEKQFIYGTDGNLYKEIRPDGSFITYDYDALRRVREKSVNYYTNGSQLESHTWAYEYNEDDTISSETDPRNNTTSYSYNLFGQIYEIYYPASLFFYLYDWTGKNVIREYNSSNSVEFNKTYTYDGLNNMLSSNISLMNWSTYDYYITRHIEYEYYSDGLLKKEIIHRDESLSKKTEYYYDGFENVVTTKVLAVAIDDGTEQAQTTDVEIITTYTYDFLGNKLSQTDPRDNTIETVFEYDKGNMLRKITYPDGGYVEYDYTGSGRKTDEYIFYGTDNGNDLKYHTEYSYNAHGKVEQILYPDGGKEFYTYWPTGNVKGIYTLQKIDYGQELYEYIGYKYEGRGLLEEVTISSALAYDQGNGDISLPGNAPLYVTQYQYDENGNLTNQIDARGKETVQEFDAMNRLTKIIDPNLNYIEYSDYDVFGNYWSKTNREEIGFEYVYDLGLSQLRKISTTENEEILYEYDLMGNVTSMEDSTGTTTYSYNNAGWLMKKEYPCGHTITYTHDKAGNVICEKVQNNGQSSITVYEYDEMNRMSKVTDPDNNFTEYAYDYVGRRATLTYPNGVTVTYEYDERNRLVNLTNYSNYEGEGSPNNQVLSFYIYTYDKAGNLLSREDANGIASYEYDGLNRLIKESYPDGTSIEYTYDEVSNRKEMIHRNSDGHMIKLVKYNYDDVNRLIDEEVLQITVGEES